MREQNQSSGSGLLLAVLAGAAVGAGVALLFAPRSGQETRQWLARRTRELKDQTASAYEQGKEAVQRTAIELRKVAGEAVKRHDGPMDA